MMTTPLARLRAAVFARHDTAAAIRAARTSVRMSQQTLANRAGVSRQTIVAWEANRTAPTTDQLEAVITALEGVAPC